MATYRRKAIEAIDLYNAQDIEDFVQSHGGMWPIRGYVYMREVIYHRKRDGGTTVRHLPTLFMTCSRLVSERIPTQSDGGIDSSTELSSYSNEELGYI